MDELYFAPTSGCGDMLLDLVGFVVFCKYKNKKPIISWCKNKDFYIQPWGIANFDEKLFDFNSLTLVDQIPNNMNRAFSRNTGASFNVIKLHLYLNISIENLIKSYKETAQSIIKPSSLILDFCQINILSKCIGIHLRRSDKIKNKHEKIDKRHETMIDEYDSIINKLKDCIKNLIINSSDVWFFICSEDKEFKNEFTNEVIKITKSLNKNPKFYIPKYPDLPGSEAIVDLFSLSKCKCILQGIKYSTFSIMASIIGNNILYNFAVHDETSLIHLWTPFIKLINNGIYKDYDIDLMKKIDKTIFSMSFSNPSLRNSFSSITRFLPNR
jgi:hypothetical protein